MQSLWYRVKIHELTYSDFVDALNSNKIGDSDFTTRLFIYCTIYNHDPYYRNSHIITYLGAIGNKTDFLFYKYYFIYVILKNNIINEKMYNDNSVTFKNSKCETDNNFYGLITSILHSVLKAFINEKFYIKDVNSNDYPPDVRVPIFLNSLKNFQYKWNISFNFLNEKDIFGISVRIKQLEDFLLFLKGHGELPTYITEKMSEKLLYNIHSDLYSKISLSEDKIISVCDEVIKNGSVEFQDYYISSLKEIYSDNVKINEFFAKILKPNPVKDVAKIKEILGKLSPTQKQEYIPSIFPVHENALNTFCDNILANGFEKVFHEKLNEYKKLINEQLKRDGVELINQYDLCLDDILNYPFSYLVWDQVKNGVYLLPISDLRSNGGINYYTKEKVIFKDDLNIKSETFQKKWSDLLRRNIK